MGLFDFLGGGGEQKQVTNPSQLDWVNADVANTLAPYLMQNIVADLGGGMTAGKSGEIGGAMAKAAAGGYAPGSAQLYTNFSKALGGAGKGASGNAMQMAQMLYGKQPQMGPSGGSTTITPGIQDYLNTALNIYKAYNSFNSPIPASKEPWGNI